MDTTDPAQKVSLLRRKFSAAGRMLAAPSTRAAFFAFALTRILILCVVLLSSNLVFEPPVRDPLGAIHRTSLFATRALQKRLDA